MRLRRFEIRNFKGIHEATLELEDIAVLIGENNVGKSTVIQALRCFLGGSQIKDESLFREHRTDNDHAIELVGHFEQLTPAEQQASAVRGRMHGDRWIIKKRFWTDQGEPDDGIKVWREQYYSYSSQETFAGWPEPDNSWGGSPPNISPSLHKSLAGG
jgi:predicted ATP-dependent endonuclease of OLD family